MFKERVPSSQHASDATWRTWVALIAQQAQMGKPDCPGMLELVMDWSGH